MGTSLLTIGTEITTGETLNTNAQWISARLEDLGHEIRHHLSVPDELVLMRQALDFLSSSKILFVTGGLGPTQDDLTREVMADWLGVELEFSHEAWEGLKKLAEERGMTVREAHRRQCYFPKGAVTLPNKVGSALGFSVHKQDIQVFVLPGPPRELHDMWIKCVEPKIGRGLLSPWVKWVFEGLRESEVSERFELILSKFSDPKKIEIGYRAAAPLIHVKVREAFVPKGFREAVTEEFKSHLIS